MRTIRTLSGLVIVPLLAIACGGDLPTDTRTPEPSFAVAGESGCYTVKVTASHKGNFPVFPGTNEGDLVGTSVVIFDFPPPTQQTGETWNLIGEATFDVTGGIIPELVGKSFTVSLESRNVFNQEDLFAKIANLKTRAISGVQKANLTGQGETQFPDPADGFKQQVDSWFNGVICP